MNLNRGMDKINNLQMNHFQVEMSQSPHYLSTVVPLSEWHPPTFTGKGIQFKTKVRLRCKTVPNTYKIRKLLLMERTY